MDLDQLHTFLEIVRLKSFSKAAQSCFRTQPAVSAQVRQLEQDLNAPLFERLGTKIALTPAGRIFADYAEQILDLRRRAQDAINELERTRRTRPPASTFCRACSRNLKSSFRTCNSWWTAPTVRGSSRRWWIIRPTSASPSFL